MRAGVPNPQRRPRSLVMGRTIRKSHFMLLFVCWILTSSAPAALLGAVEEDPKQIIIPSKPAPVEQHAAAELASYLKKMSGIDFPVVSEDAADRAIRAIDLG